jgi:hypothetical protein
LYVSTKKIYYAKSIFSYVGLQSGQWSENFCVFSKKLWVTLVLVGLLQFPKEIVGRPKTWGIKRERERWAKEEKKF